MAGSRKLFDQLEEEEAALEREFASFKNNNMAEIASLHCSEALSKEPVKKLNLPKCLTVDNKTVTFVPKDTTKPSSAASLAMSEEERSQSTLTPTAGIATVSSPGTKVISPVTKVISPVPKATSAEPAQEKSDMMENLDPVMQQYLNRVLEAKKGGGEGAAPIARHDDTENIEHVEFDKTDSDFSW